MSAPGHSRLAPSSAERWTTCTASIKFIEDNDAILPPSGGVEADEGTRAHSYLTALLKHTLGQVPDNEEMRDTIQKLVDYIHGLMRPSDTLLVDQRVPLFYLPQQSGTLDVAIVGPDRIIVLDLKYGVGVGVWAEKNKQLAIYAESQIRVLEKAGPFLPATPVHLVIYQPRDRNDPTVVREWVINRGDLKEFCKEIQSKADTVLLDFQTEFRPTEKGCFFCRARKICKARGTEGLEVICDAPVDVVLDSPALVARSSPAITREQRQKILRAKKTFIAFLEALEDQEVAELMNGAQPDQFKLVEGKTDREWSDEEKAKALLATVLLPDEVCPPKPIRVVSPYQAEKALKGVAIPENFMADLHALITKPKGAPTLVPIEDKRPALLLNPTEGLNPISQHDPHDLI